jgi:hypothetical protein
MPFGATCTYVSSRHKYWRHAVTTHCHHKALYRMFLDSAVLQKLDVPVILKCSATGWLAPDVSIQHRGRMFKGQNVQFFIAHLDASRPGLHIPERRPQLHRCESLQTQFISVFLGPFPARNVTLLCPAVKGYRAAVRHNRRCSSAC